MKPDETPCNLVQPKLMIRQNEPKPPDARQASPYATAKKPAAATSPACNEMKPDETPCNRVQPKPRVGKTNPPQGMTTLTAQQLAAARLFAYGYSVAAVVEELRISRITLASPRRLRRRGLSAA